MNSRKARTGEVFAFYKVTASSSEQGHMNQSDPGDFSSPQSKRESDAWVLPRAGPDLTVDREARVRRLGGKMTCWSLRKSSCSSEGAPEADLIPAFEWIVTRSQGAWSCNWYWSLNDPLLTLEFPTGLIWGGVYPWTMRLQEPQCAPAGVC